MNERIQGPASESVQNKLGALSLTHYSAKPVGAIRDADWMKDEPSGSFKPVGFWVSVDGEDDWRSWCEAEDYGLSSLVVRTRITLATDANVLLVATLRALDAFNDEFKGEFWEGIRWLDVAARWDGIIIAPYQWGRRLARDFSWYYGWDCASGCIWKARAIKSVSPLVTRTKGTPKNEVGAVASDASA